MTNKCSNCGRTIWSNVNVTCACGGTFCCKACSDEWHNEKNKKREKIDKS